MYFIDIQNTRFVLIGAVLLKKRIFFYQII